MEELAAETGFSAPQLQRLLRVRFTTEMMMSTPCNTDNGSPSNEFFKKVFADWH
jgi:hypothetical protein